jgi:hypothetical protein
MTIKVLWLSCVTMPSELHTPKWRRCVKNVQEKNDQRGGNPSVNPYAVCTAAMKKRKAPSKKKDPPKKDPPKKDPPKKRAPRKKPCEAKDVGGMPVEEIKGTVTNKGDDTRRQEDFLRAKPPEGLKDFCVNVDPSTESHEVPRNMPDPGAVPGVTPGIVEEDSTLNPTGNKDRVSDTDTLAYNVDRSTLPAHQREMQMRPEADVAQSFLGKRINLPQSIPQDPREGEQQGCGGRSKTGALTTIRPLMGIADPMGFVPSTRNQIKSNLLFSEFHIVAPGFGLGVNNKMYLMNEMRQQKLIYHEPLAFPRSYQGPSGCVLAPPFEWQNEMSKPAVKSRESRQSVMAKLGEMAANSVGEGSLNLLGDDYGLLRTSSAKGLARPPDSVTEPVILKPTPMERGRLLTGMQLDGKKMRRLFDADRWPEHFVSRMGLEGGATMPRQKALRLLPFPIGTC